MSILGLDRAIKKRMGGLHEIYCVFDGVGEEQFTLDYVHPGEHVEGEAGYWRYRFPLGETDEEEIRFFALKATGGRSFGFAQFWYRERGECHGGTGRTLVGRDAETAQAMWDAFDKSGFFFS